MLSFLSRLAAPLLLAWSPAFAQDFHAAPTNADHMLVAGAGEAIAVSVQGGGDNPISARSADCSGYIADAPEVRVLFTAGAAPLVIGLEPSGQASLIVNMPNGRWRCAPAEAPSLRFDPPRSGRYAVWVGASAPGATATANVNIGEATP